MKKNVPKTREEAIIAGGTKKIKFNPKKGWRNVEPHTADHRTHTSPGGALRKRSYWYGREGTGFRAALSNLRCFVAAVLSCCFCGWQLTAYSTMWVL